MSDPNADLIEALPQVVSFFATPFDQEPAEQAALGDILGEIRAGAWENEIRILRKRLDRGDAKGYDEAKRKLPGFTMSAAMMTRDKSVPVEHRVLSHSGILQADFDAKENPQLGDVAEVKALLAADPYVAFVFVSPSGRGVKAGVRIDGERHRGCFFAAEAYYLKKYGLQMDRAVKDRVRMCFVSHDPDLVCNGAEGGRFEPVSEKEDRSPRPAVPLSTTAADIEEMLGYVPKRPAYDDWLRIASAVWSVLPMAEGCRVLNAWSPEERQGEYAEKWRHRLEEVGVGTLAWYAAQNGFDARAAARRKMWAGRLKFAEPTVRDVVADEDFTEDPAGEPRQVELTREFVAQCLEDVQLGDAKLWAAMVAGRRLYDHLGQTWRRYEDGIWQRDDMQRTTVESAEMLARCYQSLAESVRADMREDPPQKKKGGGRGRPEKDPRERKLDEIGQRVKKIHSTGYLSGVMKFAESLLPCKATDFDQLPGLLATRNGVLDLAKGEFREHNSADMLTHKTICDFDWDADCPRWERFLDYFTGGDRELIEYLARAVGYSLTGYVDKDVLFFLYGKGANGKSTFTSVLQMLLGDGLMTTVGIDRKSAKASDNNFDYKKAQMEGKRIVVSDEIPESRKLNEAAIKSLVGGDAITARRPYEKPYVFMPTHKLWLVGNHKPTITGTDHGIWRRVHLVPWTQTIPEADRRPRHEVLAELREELPGILNWAVRGYLDMVDGGGLRPPKAVVDATKEYRTDSDQFARFMHERTEPLRGMSVSLTQLRETYMAWCEDEGEEPRHKTNKKIANYLRDAGWIISQSGHAKTSCVLGLSLRDFELSA